MKKTDKHSVELQPDEYETLMQNQMIASMCDHLLSSPRKRSGYIVLSLTEADLEELVGWVAAEANHANTIEEEDALSEVSDGLESILSSIGMKKN